MHETVSGAVDRTKTDLYLHFVDRSDHSILDVDRVLALLDQNIETLDPLFKVGDDFSESDVRNGVVDMINRITFQEIQVNDSQIFINRFVNRTIKLWFDLIRIFLPID